MNMISIRRVLVVSVAALALCEAAPTELCFIPTTPENPKDREGDWKWLLAKGSQGVFESYDWLLGICFFDEGRRQSSCEDWRVGKRGRLWILVETITPASLKWETGV
jgi:hypothetical protein